MKKQKNPFAAWADVNEDYSSKWADYKLLVPSNFRMLCALFETRTEEILSSFMWDLSRMMSTATDERRRTALEYFLQTGHGQAHYTKEEMQQLFAELDARRSLWPENEDKHMDGTQRSLHCTWSNMYMQYWFRKWYYRHRMKGEKDVMKDY